jgi:hypothetical protein
MPAEGLCVYLAQTDLQLALVEVDDVRVAVREQTLCTPLTADTTFLVAREDAMITVSILFWNNGQRDRLRLRSGLFERVDKDTAGLQTESDTLGSLLILTPDTSTKTSIAVVGTVDNFFLIRVRLARNNETKLLFLDDLAVVGRVVDDGGLKPETVLLLDISAAGNEVVALVLAVLEESLDLFVLHLVLDGAEHGTFLVGCADLEAGGDLCHCVDHGSVDLLVDVDTLGGDANLVRKLAFERYSRDDSTYLTTVLEGTHDKLRSSSLNVDILSDDTGIVASKLKSHTLEGLAAGSHDLLSCGNATSETDLGDTGVLGEHGTKLVVTTEDLNDTGREDGLGQLDCLQRGVGGERRRLDDDGASGKQSRGDLAE